MYDVLSCIPMINGLYMSKSLALEAGCSIDYTNTLYY